MHSFYFKVVLNDIGIVHMVLEFVLVLHNVVVSRQSTVPNFRNSEIPKNIQCIN